MNDQIEITLGAIGKTVTGKTPSSGCPEDFGEGYPFVTPTDSLDSKYVLHTARQLSEEGLQKLRSKALPPDSVLVSCIGSAMGKVAMNEAICITNQQLNSIVVNQNRFCPHYVYYALKNSYKLLRNAASGSTALPMLNKTDFEKLKIRIFKDKSCQTRIAAVLSALDAKIELNQRLNAELEGLAKLLYDYWFVQYDFPISPAQAKALGKPSLAGKPYRSSGGPMVFHPQLKREIPKGWEGGVAKDLFLFNPPVSIRKGEVAAYLDMDALPTSGFMTKQIQRKEFNGGTKFTNGDVLVARITPCLENGKTGLVTLLDKGEAAFGTTEFIVMRGRHMPLSAFGCCLSRSDYFRKYAVGNMTGTSGRKRLEAPILEKLPISIPPPELLVEFEKICGPMFQLMTEHTQQSHHLAQLRDWLLPMLMNGQVRVGSSQSKAM